MYALQTYNKLINFPFTQQIAKWDLQKSSYLLVYYPNPSSSTHSDAKVLVVLEDEGSQKASFYTLNWLVILPSVQHNRHPYTRYTGPKRPGGYTLACLTRQKAWGLLVVR